MGRIRQNSVKMLAGVTALTLSTLAANAQQEPLYWPGKHIGWSIGYASGDYQQGVSALGLTGASVDASSAVLAFNFGQDYQDGSLIYGYEIDIGTGPDGNVATGTVASDFTCDPGNCNVDIKTLLTLRGRVGGVIGNTWMFYGTAGLAAAKVEGGIRNTVAQGDDTAIGWVAGIGLERALGPNAVFTAEILQVDLGTLDFGVNTTSADTFEADGDFGMLRLGVRTRF